MLSIQEEDFEELIRKQDLLWDKMEYTGKHLGENNPDRTPVEWCNGSFMGNGMIGCMVYKDAPDRLKWELGRNDTEAHNFVPGVDWCIPRVMIGDILLSAKGNILEEKMRLCLWDAMTLIHLKTNLGEITIRSYVQAREDLIVIETETGGQEEILFGYRTRHGITPRFADVKERIDTVCLPPLPYHQMIDGIDVDIQEFINERREPEGERVFAFQKRRVSENRIIFLVTVKNSFRDHSARLEAVKLLREAEIPELEKEHKTWWHRYYQKSYFSLNDAKWEAFYWIQIYKFASATRGTMSEALDNQGPWLPGSSWPGTWWNLNVQLSYSFAAKANRIEEGLSLLNAIEKNIETLHANAYPLGIRDGIYLGRATGRGLYSPIPAYEDIMDPDKKVRFELGNFLWVCFTLWQFYLSTMDEELLGRIYPLIRDGVNVYLRLMFWGKDGKWHLPRTVSPEYPEAGVDGTSYPACDTNYDLSLFYWGCKTLLQITDPHHRDAGLRERWRSVVDNLTEFPCDENGLMVAAEIQYALTHRHYSHLFPIFPLHLWDWSDETKKEIMKRSIRHFIYHPDGTERTGDRSGYTYTGAASLFAAMGQGNEALEMLERFYTYLQPNTMYLEQSGSAVMETPLSAVESLHNLLLQCHEGEIKVFPAVPDAWTDFHFSRFLAEGAFEISGKRAAGCNLYVHVKSLAGSRLRIHPGIENVHFDVTDQGAKVLCCPDGFYEAAMEKGAEIAFYAGHP